jgi:hypothetical protein
MLADVAAPWQRQGGGDGGGAGVLKGVSMSLDEEYPKSSRRDYSRLRRLLECVPDLGQQDRVEIADTLNDMARLASDLNDIVSRLTNEEHTPGEIGELLIAFELTTEQIRGHSDTIDGKLYEIGDRLKTAKLARRAKS